MEHRTVTRIANPLARRTSQHAEAADRLRTITRQLLQLGDEVVISVNELACCRTGCRDTETIVAVLAPGQKTRVVRFPKPLREINVLELTAAFRETERDQAQA